MTFSLPSPSCLLKLPITLATALISRTKHVLEPSSCVLTLSHRPFFSVVHKKRLQNTLCNPFLNKSVLAVSKSLPGQMVWDRYQFTLPTHHIEYYNDNSFHVIISLSTITDTVVNTAVFRPRKNNYKPTNETMFNF